MGAVTPTVKRHLRARTGFLLALALAALLAPSLAAANHSNPPRNDTASGGVMQCNTTSVPVKAGALSSVSQRYFVVSNQDNGYLRITGDGSAIGPIGCTFEVHVTGYRCPVGAIPRCNATVLGSTLCAAKNANCPAWTDVHFEFDFQAPSLTTHIWIDYELIVYTGEDPLHFDPVVVASGAVEYYEPPVPGYEGRIELPAETPV